MLESFLILGLSVLYLAIPMIFLKERDWNALLIALIVGIVAGLISAIIETLSSEYIPSFYSSPTQIVFFAPLLEEVLKFTGSLVYLRKKTIVSIPKSMVFGYNVGLGLGVHETLSKTLGAPLFAVFPRVFLTMPMHILAALVSAYGLGYALQTGRKLYYSLLWLGIAFAIHALFNFFALQIQL